MFAKFSNTWALMGASWRVLKNNKRLAIFPLLSSIACLVVAASFIVPVAMSGAWQQAKNGNQDQQILGYVIAFVFYFCTYTVITFFNVAIVSGAIQSLTGSTPSIGSCLRDAASRIHLILGWALVSATVGVVLRIIQERSGKLGQFIVSLLGVAWTFASFLVVPSLVVDNLGPIAALQQSARLLRQTWGEKLVGNFSFGLIFFLLMLPGFLAIGFGVFALVAMQTEVIGILILALAVAYLIGLGLVQATLQSIFQAAVFLYTKGVHEHGFPAELMCNAISGQKPAV